ncbi:PRC-barrel domain-containing protein [Salinarimonas ramus]|uniref:PRC-barrel domain-containing protein n=1 Tax=Salinarimonas ramus TaxID=690164 RepID=A0A917QBE1_9HYPH|nr:PRC-barrel domain-containing protein [Salinarimonas ramus]GGK41828.1 hypothetical protein GCM10011322_31220 [Salinarimonas ramus]
MIKRTTFTRTSTLAIVAALAASPALAQTATETVDLEQAGTLETPEVVALSGWNTDEFYGSGWSAEEFIDEYEVYGIGGEEIGDVEDIIVGADGEVIAVVAEIGGFIDIGDTHVAVPWSEIELAYGDRAITIPVTEDNIDEYGVYGRGYAFGDGMDVTGSVADQQVVAGIDDQELGPRAYRVSEVIGDYARIRGADDTPQNYGYVNDVIISEGRVQAVVVNPDSTYGRGYYAYPYYGPYGYGAGYGTGMGYGTGTYYDLPYREDEMGEMTPFEYEGLGSDL